MLANSIYDNLPEDPEEAFLVLEEHFRAECENRLDSERNHFKETCVDYIAQVLAAISALGLEANFQTPVPSIEDVDYNTYVNFNKDVKHYRTVLEITRARRAQGFSVQFDEKARAKIHHHLAQLREFLANLKSKRTSGRRSLVGLMT